MKADAVAFVTKEGFDGEDLLRLDEKKLVNVYNKIGSFASKFAAAIEKLEKGCYCCCLVVVVVGSCRCW